MTWSGVDGYASFFIGQDATQRSAGESVLFQTAVVSRYIRLYIQSYNLFPAMRAALLVDSQTQDGAVIEMSGNDPKLIFGTLENPTCQLSIDRPNSRLVSTCSIHESRRLEETVEREGKYLALEKKYVALQSEVSELRRSVDTLMVGAARTG